MKRRLTVLVADDSRDDRELLREAMDRDGIEADLYEAHDGEEVIDYLKQTESFGGPAPRTFPDVLILDLKMPRLDGFQVLDWIRSHPQCRTLPVVLLSGSGLERDVKEAYKRGANTYFSKPNDFSDFRRLVGLLVNYWEMSERHRHTSGRVS
jgi:CheY-like chemotaxis protein